MSDKDTNIDRINALLEEAAWRDREDTALDEGGLIEIPRPKDVAGPTAD